MSLANKALALSRPASVTACTVTGNLTLIADPPHTFPITIKSRGSSELRTELKTDKGLRIMVVKNGIGVMQQPNGSTRKLSYSNTKDQRIPHLPGFSALGDVGSNDVSAQYLGVSPIDGTMGISLNRASNQPFINAAKSAKKTGPDATREMRFYIDPNSGLVKRVQATHFSEESDTFTQKSETTYEDYRNTDNMQVPYHQSIFDDGKHTADLILTSVDCHSPLADADFEYPKLETKNAK